MEVNRSLTKSKFLKGWQCPKALYLRQYYPEWQDPVTEEKQALFDKGRAVGEKAHQLFPGGINIKERINWKKGFYEEITQKTKEAIARGEECLYEAGFYYDDLLVLSDMLVKKNGKWSVYEVKMSTRVKEQYILDGAIQYYVIQNSKIPIDRFYLVHIDNDYVREGELDVDQLFQINDITEKVTAQQNNISKMLRSFRRYLRQNTIPDIPIGQQCFDPYECDFRGYCWQSVPANSVFDIYGLKKDKKFELYHSGYQTMQQLPEVADLNEKQRLQVSCHVNEEAYIDKKGIKRFLDKLTYPLHFLDFETFQPPIPLFDKSHPYQQIPFQYSLHRKRSSRGMVEHMGYLAAARGDPRFPLVDHLLRQLGQKGSIIAYHTSFEKKCLKEIGYYFPTYEEKIQSLQSRWIDLKLPFKNMYYYSPAMKGSFSLKSVLPALVPELSYDALAIQEGTGASRAFEVMRSTKDQRKVKQLRQQLWHYCKRDTYALVKLLEQLYEVV